MKRKRTTKTFDELITCKEPQGPFKDYEDREIAREKAYGGRPPKGYSSWGDYWKSI